MEKRWPDTQRPLRPLAYSVLALHPSNWNAFLPLEWFQTTKRLATPGFPSFEADVSSIGPPGCQREGPAGHTTGALRCEDLVRRKGGEAGEIVLSRTGISLLQMPAGPGVCFHSSGFCQAVGLFLRDPGLPRFPIGGVNARKSN